MHGPVLSSLLDYMLLARDVRLHGDGRLLLCRKRREVLRLHLQKRCLLELPVAVNHVHLPDHLLQGGQPLLLRGHPLRPPVRQGRPLRAHGVLPHLLLQRVVQVRLLCFHRLPQGGAQGHRSKVSAVHSDRPQGLVATELASILSVLSPRDYPSVVNLLVYQQQGV